METNRSIEISRRIYASLLNLYPQEHRAEYGADMLQLFTDQCRAVKNRSGLAALWLRSLIDLGISALREQLSSPHRTLGLLEAPPNAPLPWKGVALVLIPGLIFFISQVAQLTGEDWFFIMVYRGAFFLILPVLLVWAWKRKFPIWGLVPLGLLVRTVLILAYKLQYEYVWEYRLKAWRDQLSSFNRALDLPKVPVDTVRTVMMFSLALICLGLLVWVIRRAGVPRRAWIWLGVYVLVAATTMGLQVWHVISSIVEPSKYPSDMNLAIFRDYAFQYLFSYGGFLALILAGALLARRHGQLATLLPLGYLLPTVLFGRMVDDWPSATAPEYTIMLLIGVGTLIYRFLVALAGPLWIVRSTTTQGQKRSNAVSLIILIVIQAACNIILVFYYYGAVRQVTDLYFAISDQLIIAAGIALALSMYRPLPAQLKPSTSLPVTQVVGQ